MPASGQSKVKWYKSLSFLGLFALTLVPLWDLGGIFAVMKTQGNKLVLQESSRLIEQIGNRYCFVWRWSYLGWIHKKQSDLFVGIW